MSTEITEAIPPTKELMTPQEVSELTGYSLKALASHRGSKTGFPYYKFNRRIFYKQSEIMAAIEKTKVETSAKAL
ncbi:helix-turn-helix domain-containing protein [Sulfurimonas crateris]|uniref:Helix-turn-helix domain-containing protein n=1 Tax=Sulfurimonas crateris TaxID=2574727 RepID=A0A4U2Z9B1_9BACT|nr:helix-turn-helix domain-containing protein [Sulfurimonas crateris]TKI70898.1 helix-turn-helix domain-containing protein [Sulfurimonas crateris]